MENKIPEAMEGTYRLTLDQLMDYIEKQKDNYQEQEELVQSQTVKLQNTAVSIEDWESLRQQLPAWREIFLKADAASKRVLVDKLISRVEITNEQVIIRFKISLDEFLNQPQMINNELVPK